MAKVKKNPYPKKLKSLEGFILVTEENKKKALVVGRLTYRISNLMCEAPMEIRMRLVKGHWFCKGHQNDPDWDFWVIEGEESVQEHRDYLLKTIGKIMQEGKLYIRLDDKIAKYERG